MKLIVTSATMDAQKFADFFGNVPTFQVRVIAFVFNCVRLKWVKSSSVFCVFSLHMSPSFLSLFFPCWFKTKGFSCPPSHSYPKLTGDRKSTLFNCVHSSAYVVVNKRYACALMCGNQMTLSRCVLRS